jgi:hypothetical protein
VFTVDTSGPTFVAGKAAEVFDAKYAEPNPARHYDVSPDRSRFLVLNRAAPMRTPHRLTWLPSCAGSTS